MRFRRKKVGLAKRFVGDVCTDVRDCYLYCKVWLSEKAAVSVARRYMVYADADNTPGISGRWLRCKTRWTGRRFRAQAAICRYARRSGTYRNL